MELHICEWFDNNSITVYKAGPTDLIKTIEREF